MCDASGVDKSACEAIFASARRGRLGSRGRRGGNVKHWRRGEAKGYVQMSLAPSTPGASVMCALRHLPPVKQRLSQSQRSQRLAGGRPGACASPQERCFSNNLTTATHVKC